MTFKVYISVQPLIFQEFIGGFYVMYDIYKGMNISNFVLHENNI